MFAILIIKKIQENKTAYEICYIIIDDINVFQINISSSSKIKSQVLDFDQKFFPPHRRVEYDE